MKKILNPYLNKEGYNCVCCAPNNPVGLHLEFWEEGEDVLTIWNPGENYQGWINTLHGGIISMLGKFSIEVQKFEGFQAL